MKLSVSNQSLAAAAALAAATTTPIQQIPTRQESSLFLSHNSHPPVPPNHCPPKPAPCSSLTILTHQLHPTTVRPSQLPVPLSQFSPTISPQPLSAQASSLFPSHNSHPPVPPNTARPLLLTLTVTQSSVTSNKQQIYLILCTQTATSICVELQGVSQKS